jgi:phospholipid transport system transporter-binding protein
MQDATAALDGLQALLRTAPGPVVQVDASPLSELDTAAISVLLQCRRQVQARGMQFELLGVPAKLGALMTLYGVADLFGLHS